MLHRPKAANREGIGARIPVAPLRQAIVSVNVGTVAGTGCVASGSFWPNDTIRFDTDAFPSGGANTISLASGQLVVNTSHLTLDATGNGEEASVRALAVQRDAE